MLYYHPTLKITDPFRVAFVEKNYTVDESVGAVNVCVHLTNPVGEIPDEKVNVFVIDDPSSIYIPAGSPLASESSHYMSFLRWQQLFQVGGARNWRFLTLYDCDILAI